MEGQKILQNIIDCQNNLRLSERKRIIEIFLSEEYYNCFCEYFEECSQVKGTKNLIEIQVNIPGSKLIKVKKWKILKESNCIIKFIDKLYGTVANPFATKIMNFNDILSFV